MSKSDRESTQESRILHRLVELLVMASEETYQLAPSFVRPKLRKVRVYLDEAQGLLKRLK